MHETSSDNGKDFIGNLVNLPLTDDMLSKLQEQDTFCSHILVHNRRKEILKKDKHIKSKTNY